MSMGYEAMNINRHQIIYGKVFLHFAFIFRWHIYQESKEL